jgi:transposase
MTALQGGTATNDQIDAHKIAGLLRGGLLPQASVSPARMRATRARHRRRLSLTRKRAELLAHLQPTTSPYTLPEMGKKLAYTANRDGGAARFPEPAVHKSMAVALALLGDYAPRLRELELHIVKAATPHAPNPLSLLQTGPGIGTILRLVLLYESHDIQRFPSVQAFVS